MCCDQVYHLEVSLSGSAWLGELGITWPGRWMGIQVCSTPIPASCLSSVSFDLSPLWPSFLICEMEALG